MQKGASVLKKQAEFLHHQKDNITKRTEELQKKINSRKC